MSSLMKFTFRVGRPRTGRLAHLEVTAQGHLHLGACHLHPVRWRPRVAELAARDRNFDRVSGDG